MRQLHTDLETAIHLCFYLQRTELQEKERDGEIRLSSFLLSMGFGGF